MTDNKTTARWEGDTLFIRWYGSHTEDEGAWWQEHHNRLIYDGYDDTYKLPFEVKPSAEAALAAIVAYQLQ